MQLSAGTKLGPYEIITPLASGGMGEVYRARDTRLDREVAIKVLPDRLCEEPEALSRFQQETKIVAALSHPNILTIFDCGIVEKTVFAVTELLEGEVLRSWMQTGTYTQEEILDTAISIAQGLAAAHSKGIIHRDLKPENIFLTADRRIKILDFGLAHWRPEMQGSGAQKTSSQTQPGTVLGTIQYLSPEQAMGEEIDPRSDLFSFGCLLYEISTGKNPFMKPTVAETLAAILRDDPDFTQCDRNFPALSTIIRKCLEKRKEDRFDSTQELVDALKTLRGSSAPTLPWPAPHRKYGRNIAILSGILALVVVGSWLLFHSRNRIQTIAVLPFVNSGGNSEMDYLSDGITESIINSVSRLPRIRVMARSTAFKYKGKNVDPQTIGKELNVSAILEGTITLHDDVLNVQTELIRVSDGSQLWGQQYYRKPDDILVLQEEIARQISRNLQIHLTGEEEKLLEKHPTESGEAYQLYLKGRYYLDRRTESAFQKATDYFQQAIQVDPHFVLAYTGLADAYCWASNLYLPPKEAMPKAKQYVSKALALDDQVAEVHNSLALINTYYDWSFPVAELEYKRAIELNPGYAAAHQWYGRHLIYMGRFDEATQELRIAQQLDPLSLSTNVELGLPFYFQHKYDQAIHLYKKALELDPAFPWAHLYMAQAYEQKQDFTSAIQEYNLISDLSKKLAGLGYTYARMGKVEDARKCMEQLQDLSKSRYVSAADRASIYVALGEFDQAFAYLNQAVQSRDEAIVRLKINPRLDPIRNESRFQNLLKKIGL